MKGMEFLIHFVLQEEWQQRGLGVYGGAGVGGVLMWWELGWICRVKCVWEGGVVAVLICQAEGQRGVGGGSGSHGSDLPENS